MKRMGRKPCSSILFSANHASNPRASDGKLVTTANPPSFQRLSQNRKPESPQSATPSTENMIVFIQKVPLPCGLSTLDPPEVQYEFGISPGAKPKAFCASFAAAFSMCRVTSWVSVRTMIVPPRAMMM
mmetsp:Transcript_1167/g.2735  ORF Transcript_1167/g.2735 Transcript_1167/m.2735 type:complete len:128 (+) Transcript_1167:217-600(+)